MKSVFIPTAKRFSTLRHNFSISFFSNWVSRFVHLCPGTFRNKWQYDKVWSALCHSQFGWLLLRFGHLRCVVFSLRPSTPLITLLFCQCASSFSACCRRLRDKRSAVTETLVGGNRAGKKVVLHQLSRVSSLHISFVWSYFCPARCTHTHRPLRTRKESRKGGGLNSKWLFLNGLSALWAHDYISGAVFPCIRAGCKIWDTPWGKGR